MLSGIMINHNKLRIKIYINLMKNNRRIKKILQTHLLSKYHQKKKKLVDIIILKKTV